MSCLTNDVKYNLKIKDLLINDTVIIYGLIISIKEKITSNSKPYIEFLLQDNTGDIKCKLWDYDLYRLNNYIGRELKKGDIIKIKGNVQLWNDKKQIIINKIRLAKEEDRLNITDFIKKAPIEPEIMFNEIFDIVSNFKNKELREINIELLNRYKNNLLYYPASQEVHHNIMAGLLFHIYRMLKLAEKIVNIYENIDKELLITGVIVHDIAKIFELDSNKYGIVDDYTKEGKLLGHIVQGIKIISKFCEELKIHKELSLLIEHMIASHHYHYEYGAVKKPMIIEAEILHYLDMIDSRIFMFNEKLESVNNNEFTDRIYFLDNRQIYRHI